MLKTHGGARKTGIIQACAQRLKGWAYGYQYNMEIKENLRFDEERALYASNNLKLKNCRFEGPADGESALKECENIVLENCYCDLRYPMWHCDNLVMDNTVQTENCRAALWYDRNITLKNSDMGGIKAVRECEGVTIENCKINSPEFAWRSRDIKIADTKINSQYAFFESRNIEADGMELEGKYTFQYIENSTFRNCRFQTKDAFWHAKNVTVYDSVLGGEYLAWYSENLTLVRCHIKGTQPLCYCKNLKLIDCTTEDCDLAFEYCSVDATIKGKILSVKNPESGRICADEIGELIVTDDSKRPVNAEVYEAGRRILPKEEKRSA